MVSRVVVITGGASGIGLGIAQWFAREGHKVAMLDRQADAAKAESDALNAQGYTTLAAAADVTSREQMAAGFERVRAEFGPVEALITSAGVVSRSPFLDMSVQEWQRVIDINLTGTFHACQLALPDMVAKKWGRIVTISSMSAQIGAAGMANYVASKGGVIALTKGLAAEFAAHGITVNTIPPSIVVTPMGLKSQSEGKLNYAALAEQTPVKRVGTADDIAAACAYLCSDHAGFITGQQVNVNGGWYL